MDEDGPEISSKDYFFTNLCVRICRYQGCVLYLPR